MVDGHVAHPSAPTHDGHLDTVGLNVSSSGDDVDPFGCDSTLMQRVRSPLHDDPHIGSVHQLVVLTAQDCIIECDKKVEPFCLVLLSPRRMPFLRYLKPVQPSFGSIEGRKEESLVVLRSVCVGRKPLRSVLRIEHPCLVSVVYEVSAVGAFHPCVNDLHVPFRCLIMEVFKLKCELLSAMRTWNEVFSVGRVLHQTENQRVFVCGGRAEYELSCVCEGVGSLGQLRYGVSVASDIRRVCVYLVCGHHGYGVASHGCFRVRRKELQKSAWIQLLGDRVSRGP